MSIQDELNQIKNAVYGKDVRDAIHDSIKKTYDDASASGNANMEVEMARGTHPNLRSRLEEVDDKQQQHAAQLAQTEQEISKKANQIDLDVGLAAALDGGPSIYRNTLSELVADYPNGASGTALVFETDPAYLYIWENESWTKKTAYNGIKLNERSVEPMQTTFFEASTNLFDKSKIEMDKSISSNLTPIDAVGFVLSDFIRVNELEKTVFKNVRTYAYYKADKSPLDGSRVALSSGYAGHVATNPTGAFWVRFAWYLSNEPLNTQQVNIGDKLLPYEEHQIIPIKYKGNRKFSKKDVDFYVPNAFPSKNRHNPNSAVTGFINQDNGVLMASDSYRTFEVDVVPGEELTFSVHNRSAFYTESGAFIVGSGLFNNTAATNTPLTVTVPNAARTIKYSLTKSFADGNFQLESGNVATSYTKPGFTMPDLILSHVDDDVDYYPDINLPSKIYATVGEELTIYNQNILKDKESEFNIDWDCSVGKQMSDRYVVTPTTTGNVNLTFNLYRKAKLISTKNVTIVVSNPRTTPVTVLEIGDSTTHAAANAYAVKRLKDKLGTNITQIGTQTSILDPDVKYVGFGGWKAETYRTPTEGYGAPNPFYDPILKDFSFAYYMTQNGFSSVDVVILNLGINDVFGSKDDAGAISGSNASISNTDFIINSILAYDPTIKIALNIAIPPNADQDVFGNIPDVALFQTQWRAKYNNFIYAEKLINHYQGQHDLIPIHAVIDTVNNIDDHVHPTETGYYQIGDQKYNYLNSI